MSRSTPSDPATAAAAGARNDGAGQFVAAAQSHTPPPRARGCAGHRGGHPGQRRVKLEHDVTPPSQTPLIITAAIFVVSWIAVAFSFCRDQVLHRVSQMEASVASVAAVQSSCGPTSRRCTGR